MTKSFSSFDLPPKVLKALDKMGFEEPTPVQAESLPALLEGRDLVAEAPTGTGKTAAFGLCISAQTVPGEGTQAIILVPTRELCLQVTRELENIMEFQGQQVFPIYGGVGYEPQKKALREGAEVIVGTPGRVMDLMRQGLFELGNMKVAVLDEADRMLDMGFIEDVEWILKRLPRRGVQNLLLSATLEGEVQDLADRFTRNPWKVAVARNNDRREEVFITVGRRNKPWALSRVLEAEEPRAAFVFVHTRSMASRLANILKKGNFQADSLHGGMTQGAREKVMKKVREGKVKVVVATDVLSRGIDVDFCDLVVNYDLPSAPEDYVHRVGRTARMEGKGKAVTIATPDEEGAVKSLQGTAGADLNRVEVPEKQSEGKERIRRLQDWSEVASPTGIITFEVQGIPDGWSRFKLTRQVTDQARLQDIDLGRVSINGTTAMIEVHKEAAKKFVDAMNKAGLDGKKVQVQPIPHRELVAQGKA